MVYPKKKQRLLCGLIAAAGLGSATASPSEKPMPTPRPGSLAAYAGTIKLRETAATDESGRVTISNANIQSIGCTTKLIAGPARLPPQPTPDLRDESKRRAHWRSLYFKQQRRVLELERKQREIESDIDLIEDGRLTPRSLARLARAEARLHEIENEIRRQRSELGRIVFEARQEGAQPGWFR
jgi:hypothetical protein